MKIVLANSQNCSLSYNRSSRNEAGTQLFNRTGQINFHTPDELLPYLPPSLQTPRSQTLSVQVYLPQRINSYSYNSSFSGNCAGTVEVMDASPSKLFKSLQSQNNHGINLKVSLHGVTDNYGDCKSENWDTKESELACFSNSVYGAKCDLTIPQQSSVLSFWYNSSYHIRADISITITLPTQNVDVSVKDVLQINKKILKDELAADVTIIPKNGIPVKCHKTFLIAQSPVFETMFQTSMKESKSGTVEIVDMEEQSVRAFLEYLYFWNVEKAQKNSLIAFELLYAGNKYDVSSLQVCMKNIMMRKENTWFDIDVAMRLFLFSSNNGDNELKVKAIQVLKSQFSKLEKSPSYQQLFKKNPKAAMELCKYAFSA